MSISSRSPRWLSLDLAPGGSPPDLHTGSDMSAAMSGNEKALSGEQRPFGMSISSQSPRWLSSPPDVFTREDESAMLAANKQALCAQLQAFWGWQLAGARRADSAMRGRLPS
jgi:hypothetical protein